MRILLDTHFLTWLVIAPGKIERRERALMSRHDLVVSSVSIWELRIKWQKFENDLRRRKALLDPVVALRYSADNGLSLVALTGEDCAETLALPIPHKDPFDEMLLIHAQRLGAKLLTRDGDMQGHPLVVQL